MCEKWPWGKPWGKMRFEQRSIPGLAQGLQSTYVRREKREISGPGGAANAPGPGTEGRAFDARETVPT